MSHFIPNILPGSCEFLNLRVQLQAQPCLHCGNRDFLKAHGFLRGISQVLRGVRFYCSNRGSNTGCGRTFSVHFEGHLPHVSHSVAQVAQVIASQCQPAGAKGIPALREVLEDICAKTTAYRWIKQFRDSQTHIRSSLYLISGPDKGGNGSILSTTWSHLQQVFAGEKCVFAAFQRVLQSSPFGPPRGTRPVYDRVLSGWLTQYLPATRNGTPPPIHTSASQSFPSSPVAGIAQIGPDSVKSGERLRSCWPAH